MRKRIGILFALIAFWVTSLCAQVDANRAMQIGRNAIGTKDYAVAIEHLSQAIEARSDWAEPFYWRALAKLMLSDYMGAILDASSALARNPSISRAYFVRGIAYQSLGKNDQSASDYKKVIEFSPDDPDPRFNLSGALFTARKYQEAEKEVNALLLRFPDYIKGYNLSAEIYLHQNDTTKAEEVLQRSLAKDSLQAFPYRVMALIAYQKGQYDEAVQYYSQAIERSKNELSDYINRGLARFKKYDLRKALEDYDYAVTLAPSDITARYNRALLKIFVNDPNGALDDFEVIARKDPQNMVVRYNMALLKYELGMWDDAIKDFDLLLKRHPAFIDGYYYRSELKKKKGDIRGADKDYWYAYGLENKRIKLPKEPDEKELNSLLDHQSLWEDTLQSLNGKEEKRFTETRTDQSLRRSWSMYQLSYFEEGTQPFALRSNYSSELENFNLRNSTRKRLLFTQNEASLDSLSIRWLVDDVRKNEGLEEKTSETLFLLAVDYWLIRDFDKAIEYADQSIRTNPQFPFSYWVRAMARYARMGAAEKSKDSSLLREVLKDWDMMIQLSPKMPYALYNRAYIYEQIGDTEMAVSDYTRAIEYLPNPATAYYNRALLYLKNNRMEDAQKDLSLAGEKGLRSSYQLIQEIQKTK